MKRKAFVPDPDELINPVYFKTENRVTKFREVISRRQNDLHLILEDVFDPHNVSAVLRTCDSVGVGEVHLVYVEEEFPVFNKSLPLELGNGLNLPSMILLKVVLKN